MKYVLIAWWCLCVAPTFAQEPNFKNFTVEDGLLSSESYHILQDHDANIWIATDKGVNRYDGKRFYSYTKKNGLPENCVLRMYLDSKGRIWFVTLSAKMAIYENGKIHPLKINKTIEKKIGKPIINSIAMYKDTLRLSYSVSKKALKIVYEKGKFKVLSHAPRNANVSFSYVELLPNREPSYGSIIHGRNGRRENTLHLFRGKKYDRFNNFFVTNHQWFYVEHFNNKLYMAQGRHLKILSLHNNHVLDKLFNFRPFRIRLEYFHKQPVVWVCSSNGLLRYENEKLLDKPRVYFKDVGITDFCRDKEGGVWVSTLGSGIYYARNLAFHNVKVDENIISVLNYKGKLLLGTGDRALKLFDGKGLQHFEKGKMKFNYPVQRIFSIDDDCFFFQADVMRAYSKNRKRITESELLTLQGFVRDSSGRKGYFFANDCAGYFDLKEFHLKGGFDDPRKILQHRVYSHLHHRVYCAIYRGKNKILLGTNAGVIEYNTTTNEFKKLNHSLENALSLSFKGNTCWVGYKEDGVQIRRGGEVFRITADDGLSSNYCRHIFLEDEYTAWVATNRGLTLVKVQSWSPFKFKCFRLSQQDGLVCDELIEIAKWGKKIVVIGIKGLSVFEPSQLFISDYKPPLNVTGVSVNGKRQTLQASYYIRESINHILVNYQGICFRKEGRLIYRYRFKELDQEWKVTENTLIEYNGIPYGKSTLEIQVQSTNGHWNTPVKRIVFYSPAPFFETLWFKVLLVITVGFTVWMFAFWRIRVIKKRGEDRELLYRKASEMELKFLTAQMNPHFTFNAMNSIQHFMLDNDLLKAQKYLTKYAKLIRIVLESSMQDDIQLSREVEFLKLYVEIEAMRFTKNIVFTITCDIPLQENYTIPPMLIQPYIENAIWHGLFDESIEIGRIQVMLQHEKDKLYCTIEDNGIGREKARLKKSETNSSESLGMLITQKRLDKLNNESADAPEIVDLYDENGNAAGTRVILHLPLKQKREPKLP